MDFTIDENLPLEAAQLLTEVGHSVSSVLDEGLRGTTDEAVVQASTGEGRILVALDTGFADNRRCPPAASPGFIVLRVRRQDKANILRALRRAASRLDEEVVQGKLRIVEGDRIRIRS